MSYMHECVVKNIYPKSALKVSGFFKKALLSLIRRKDGGASPVGVLVFLYSTLFFGKSLCEAFLSTLSLEQASATPFWIVLSAVMVPLFLCLFWNIAPRLLQPYLFCFILGSMVVPLSFMGSGWNSDVRNAHASLQIAEKIDKSSFPYSRVLSDLKNISQTSASRAQNRDQLGYLLKGPVTTDPILVQSLAQEAEKEGHFALSHKIMQDGLYTEKQRNFIKKD